MEHTHIDHTDQAKPEGELKPVAFWQLYKNPIFLRYLRSRMRWGRLSASLILTIVITTFVFLMSYNIATWKSPSIQNSISSEDAYRATFMPIFIIQTLIMMFMGTGAVAGGITQEFEDGMIDYQRLTPMSPLAKILGYLFGLPVREWCLLGLTFIPIAIIVVGGDIPMDSVINVYSVFFLSVMLYHLLALVVVQSMKRKRLAGRVIQMLVLLIYAVFPLLSQFGIIFFDYLTVRPILKAHMLEFLPEQTFFTSLIGMDGSDASVPFYDRYLEAWSFAVMLQASLVVTFIVMLNRRWKDTSAHLVSKPFGVVFFAFFGFLLLGNTIPLAEEGNMSFSKKMVENRVAHIEARTRMHPNFRPEDEIALQNRIKGMRQNQNPFQAAELALTQTLFFVVSASLACLIIFVCTPIHSKYLVGLRRSRNLEKKWIPAHWDEAPGALLAFLVVSLLGYALYQFSSTLYTGKAVPSRVRDLVPFIPVVVLYGSLCVATFYAVYEAWDKKGLFLLLLFIWVLPVMVAMVMAVLNMPPDSLVWVSSLSPAGGYSYGMLYQPSVPAREAFVFSMIAQLAILFSASVCLIKKRRRGRAILRT